MYSLMEKSLSAKCSTSSPSVSDRFIRKAQKSMFAKKISRKGNIMEKIHNVFNSKSSPHIPKDMTTHQIVEIANMQRKQQNAKPKRNFDMVNAFVIKTSYNRPMPQLLDWGTDDLVVICSRKGVQIADLDKNYSFQKLKSAGHPTAVKIQNQGFLAGIGSTTGQVHVFDLDRQIFVRAISSNMYITSQVSSIIWNKNVVFNGSDNGIIADDVGIQKSMIFNIKGHRFTGITTMSLHQHKLAVGYENGIVSIYDIRNQQLISEKKTGQSGRNFVQWCPWKTSQLACGINKSLKTFQGDNLVQKYITNSPSVISGLKTLPMFRQICISYDKTIQIQSHKLQTVKLLSLQQSNIVHLNVRKKQNLLCAVYSNTYGHSWDIGKAIEKPIPKKSRRDCIR